ncbi:MAG: helix-turn-helix domain-containing protein [Planctomycetota bacterium]
MQRAVIVRQGSSIEPHHLGLRDAAVHRDGAASASDDYEAAKRRVIESFQREFVERALERSGGNVSQAAETCGLTRAAFQRIMRQLQIERTSFV